MYGTGSCPMVISVLNVWILLPYTVLIIYDTNLVNSKSTWILPEQIHSPNISSCLMAICNL